MSDVDEGPWSKVFHILVCSLFHAFPSIHAKQVGALIKAKTWGLGQSLLIVLQDRFGNDISL